MPTQFPTEAAAEAAIALAIQSGRFVSGYVSVSFGAGATYLAHVRHATGFTRCL